MDLEFARAFLVSRTVGLSDRLVEARNVVLEELDAARARVTELEAELARERELGGRWWRAARDAGAFTRGTDR